MHTKVAYGWFDDNFKIEDKIVILQTLNHQFEALSYSYRYYGQSIVKLTSSSDP